MDDIITVLQEAIFLYQDNLNVMREQGVSAPDIEERNIVMLKKLQTELDKAIEFKTEIEAVMTAFETARNSLENILTRY